MARPKPRMTPEEQSEAFKQEAQRRIDAGELSPTEADKRLDEMVRRSIKDHGA